MTLMELLSPTPTGSLVGPVVEAVSLLPLDPAPEWEGDDSIHVEGAEGRLALSDPRRGSSPLPGPRVVPFVRVVRPRMSGQDVIAIQRALQAAGFRKIRPTGWHGPVSVRNLIEFQKAHRLDATGAYGKPTHHALLHYFDAYGAMLLMRARRAERVHQIRQGIVAAALYGVSIRNLIDYTQGPHRLDAVERRLKPPRYPYTTDCSGFATWCYQVGGGPDPCGFRFNVHAGAHYTGTIAVTGRRVASSSPGDLILYGKPPRYEHVTVALDDVRCVSHGSAPGPLVLPIHYRRDFSHIRAYI